MTGYESKRAAARDKLDDDDTQVYQDHDDALTIAYQSGYYDGKKAAQLAQPAQPAQEPTLPVPRVLSEQELTEYQINHKRESDEYMASLNKYLPVIGALAQIESKDEACTDERMCVPCYTGQGACKDCFPVYTTPPQRTVQVSPLEFVEMVMDKEHLVGSPIVWAQWPNKENTND
jgi:hypothetical protein